MLDALVAEARLRWGLDPATGSRSSPPSACVGDADRAVAAAPDRPARDPARARRPTRRRRAAARPCRARPDATRSRSSAGSTRPTTRSGGSARPTATTVGGARRRRRSTAPIYLAPVAPGAGASPGRGRCPGSPPGCASPTAARGTASRPTTSLRKHLLEEAYEVYDALEAGATPELAGELGDLLLQIVLHAQLAAEDGVFDLADVQAAIASKIVRRHPHVFGDAEARTASDVNRQWERIKADERATAAEPTPADGRTPAARRARSTGSARRCRPSPPARRCRSGRPTSATTGRRSTASSTRSPRRPTSCAQAATDAETGRGVRRPAVRPRQRRPPARDRGRGRRPRRQRQVPAPLRERRARRRRPGRRAARPRLRRARRAVGCRQG